MATKQLINFIYQSENGGRIDYDVVYGGIKRRDYPSKPITQMTVQQLLDWQDSIDPHYPSEASGAPQVMEDTLRGMVKQGLVDPGATFDAKTQDQITVSLLQRRGLDDYQSGRITAEKFANSVAKEWASLPVVSGPKKGRSYYGGDGLNSAHATVDDFLAAIRSAKEPDPVLVPGGPAAKPNRWSKFFMGLATLLAELLKGK